MRRGIIATLLSILVSLLCLELSLRAIDPLGVVYFDDIAYLWTTRRAAAHGYDHIPGTVDVGGRFSFTIMRDGNRYTPGRFRGGPRITFVGDSQTFGYGVNDAEVWVSRVASALRLDALNIGRSGYNVENIARQFAALEGCAVWLTISNDAGDPVYYTDSPVIGAGSYLGQSLRVILQSRVTGYTTAPIEQNDDYLYRLIADRPDTLILVLEDGRYSNIMAREYGAVVIPYFTSRISRTDAHASARGNQQIADSAIPVIDDWLDSHDCT